MSRMCVDATLFDPIGPYSHAVRAGNQVFVSGTPGVDPVTGQLAGPGVYEQTVQAVRNALALVQAAGATERNIAHVQVNLVNVADFVEMNRAYAEHFTQPYPARTVIGIAALPKPGALLTLNAVAVIDEP